jgi:glycerate kinase
VDAEWVFDPITDPARPTAYIECAQACGLTLLGGPPTVQTAVAAHTYGVGQLVDAALTAGATRIAVGLGGSSTTDGGRGMIDALGGLQAARDRLAGVDLIVASDVEHPLLGPMGAAQVFGPQKGADPATVELLERRLTEWGAELDAAAGRPISGEAGAGAAGGLGAALLALGGQRESGAAIIAEHTRLADDVAVAELVITGEGRFDDQSLHGKVVSALAGGAGAHRIPVLVLAGQVTLDTAALRDAGIAAAFAVAEFAGSVQVAIDDAANQLAGLARKTAAELGR